MNKNFNEFKINKTKSKVSYKNLNRRMLDITNVQALPIAQICLWLLVLCTVVVLTLTPIFYSSKHLPLDAGQTSVGVQYTNSPWVKANNGEALFTSDGAINGETLYDLLTKVNQTEVWQDSETGNYIYKTETSSQNSSISAGQEVYYLSAKNFGKLNDGTASTNNGTANENAKGNAQIQVMLFDGATLGTISTTDNIDLNIDKASTVLWQVVYRSMDSTNDVLTLYMNDIYSDRVFFKEASPNYGYYKDSNLREVVQGTYTVLKNAYRTLDTYTVLPANIPGLWQSSVYQTGADKSQSSYTFGASLASSGQNRDAVNNGLDDLGTLHAGWTNISTTTTIPYNNDKMWVPSNYEALYKDNTTDGETSYVSSVSSADATLENSTSGGTDSEKDGRSGLWELSGYDRAGSFVWLRSGCVHSLGTAAVAETTSLVREIIPTGDGGNLTGVTYLSVRVALHLDLKALADATLAKISVGSSSEVSGKVSVPSNLQTVKSGFNYANYIAKNSTNANYAKTITFDSVDTAQHNVSSFTLQSGNTSQTISVTGASGSGIATGLCSYSYSYNNGQLQVTVNNVATSTLSVNANFAPNVMTLNLQVNNSALNSLLVLTILNGDEKIGEYGFVYNLSTQTASIIVPANTTIKILATKPFGSRVELLLDGASLTPTGVTSYEITTGALGTTKTIVASLVGNSQWSNAIVV